MRVKRRSGVRECTEKCTEKEWCTGVYREGVVYRSVQRRSGVQECTKRSAAPESTVKRSCGHESK